MEMGETPLHDLNVPVLLFGFLVMLVFFGVVYGYQCAKGRRALARWAGENGYLLVRFRRLVFPELGGFPFFASKAQQAFRIVVRLGDGSQRKGSVLLGSWWRGVDSPAAKVKWDD